MEIRIKTWVQMATWHWNVVGEDDCGICQSAYDGTCPSCRFPGDSCPVGTALDRMQSIYDLVIGTCKHAFHMHCIEHWLAQKRNEETDQGHCPLCRQTWQLQN